MHQNFGAFRSDSIWLTFALATKTRVFDDEIRSFTRSVLRVLRTKNSTVPQKGHFLENKKKNLKNKLFINILIVFKVKNKVFWPILGMDWIGLFMIKTETKYSILC